MKKIVIITGANRGLGKSLVDSVLKDSEAFVISISRSVNGDHEKYLNERLEFIEADMSKSFPRKLKNVLERIILPESLIYIMSNAGVIMPISKIGDLTGEDIENSINVNVTFPVRLINEVISTFKHNRIVIVNLTSGASDQQIEFWSLYSSAKAFMKTFIKILAAENSDGRILAYNIDPGVLNTNMQETIREADAPSRDYFLQLKSKNLLVEPDVAALSIINQINF